MSESLSKLQIKILKSFLKLSMPKLDYSAELIAKDTKISLSVVKENLPYLLERNLIELDPLEKESNYYLLTSKGRSVLANEKEIFKEKIFWSVLLPLGISVAGTVITNLLFPK